MEAKICSTPIAIPCFTRDNNPSCTPKTPRNSAGLARRSSSVGPRWWNVAKLDSIRKVAALEWPTDSVKF